MVPEAIMIATSPATHLDNTNQVFLVIFHFLTQHSIIAAFCLLLFICVWYSSWRLKRLQEEAEKATISCKPIILAMLYETRKGVGKFAVGFFIGVIMFFIGLVFDGNSGVSSIMVQTLTYMPTMALGVSQVWSMRNSISTLAKFI
jgi:hypothetical protein